MPLKVTSKSSSVMMGMSINSKKELPLLIFDYAGNIGLIIDYDQDGYNYEADVLILKSTGSLYTTGSIIKKCNLIYWHPYKGSVIIENDIK